jgi:hypothetical protein
MCGTHVHSKQKTLRCTDTMHVQGRFALTYMVVELVGAASRSKAAECAVVLILLLQRWCDGMHRWFVSEMGACCLPPGSSWLISAVA